jgi:hypothetical protein
VIGVKCPLCGRYKRLFCYKSCYFIVCNKCGIYAILNDMFDIERVKGFDRANYRLRFSERYF